MTQGLLLFDASGHLVICNRRYIDMFGLSPDVVKPGCHLRDLIRHRKELGTFTGDVDAYCERFLNPKTDEVRDVVISVPDGRTMRLAISGRAMAAEPRRWRTSPSGPASRLGSSILPITMR
jgi:PAS domain-containing protein